ncbi:MAG: hypothetical protein AB4426_32850 [Xenococcaceae cyanobacterium]
MSRENSRNKKGYIQMGYIEINQSDIAAIENLPGAEVSINEKSQIIFQNKLFTRGPDFSKNLREAAIKFCQKYSDSILCLIVESQWYLTVWIEDSETSIPDNFEKPEEKSSAVQISAQKRRIKKYRGLSY